MLLRRIPCSNFVKYPVKFFFGHRSRVEVVGTNPLRLHYLDFGFEEWKDSYCNLRSIPASLAQIEPVVSVER